MLLPPAFCQDTRNTRLSSGSSSAYDVLIVGGGITGTGIARDAAMRGLKVALVEKSDLAYGTSSRSSKLVHGGLRYLERYEFGLVFESVSERDLLSKLAPHLVWPLPFVFPGFKGDRVPLMMMAAGVTLYDVLALGRAYRLHRRYGKKATLQLEPRLRGDGLKGSLLYFDCATDDARLTLATALSAHDHGAHLFTRLRADGLRTHRGGVDGVEATDLLTGDQVTLQAHVVICALGPWTDGFLGEHRPGQPPLLRPTKGVHLVCSRQRLPVEHAVVMSGPDDHRILFAIPWGDHTYVGTTDTDYEGSADDVHADADDIAYLLKVVNRDFPGTNLTTDDVISTWAGLRPLIADEAARSESSVSREHHLQVDEDGLVIIAGGKLTTYRTMAAEVLDVTRQHLRAKGVHLEGCSTETRHLSGGGPAVPPTAEIARALGGERCAYLQGRYGSDWDAVARLLLDDSSLAERVVPGLPFVWGDLLHAIREEGALTLEDLFARRTEILLKAPDQGLECLDTAADLAGAQLGWDAARRAAEIESYQRLVADSRRFRTE
ncbi:MAG: glycerol-3-phosphate dehydrogenase/oxidase [Myxococcota bacterium]|jgi:glycerol-3-phosphate dehydrogenase|nr:glycerol-3-phosphate dehydrogenase/oxidase [Myxococcota bacterium]